MEKIKVAHVITRLIKGGAQRVCLDLIDHLDRDKYDITLIYGPQTGSEGSLFKEVESERVDLVRIDDLRREVSPLKDIKAFFKLFFVFKKEKFQIVHVHTSKVGVLGAYAARLAGVPIVIYSSHGHIFGKDARIKGIPSHLLWFFYILRKLACSLSDRIIALTPQDKEEQVVLKLARPDKFKVVYNAIDFNTFSRNKISDLHRLRELLAIGNNDYPVLGTVSRLSSEKGLDYLIDAFPRVREKFSGAKLLLIGDGPERQKLENKVRSLDLADCVKFLGFRDNLPHLLSIIDIFVMPSLYEAMGIAIAEAMAMAIPVVATRVGGVPGIVGDGEDGVLVEPRNSGAIADAVIRLALNGELMRKMGEKGKEKAEKLFSMEKMVSEIENLYHELAEAKLKGKK